MSTRFAGTMSYRATVTSAARTAVRNAVGLASASVLLSLTGVPVLAAAPFGPLAVLGGLWATCLLSGVALVAVFDFAVEAADRGVGIDFLPHLSAATNRAVFGLKLGALTFAVVAVPLVAVGVAPGPIRPLVAGLGGFVLLCWYVVVSFASLDISGGEPLGSALRAGATRAVSAPAAVIVFVLLSGVCAALAGVTVITLFLFLPGVLALLASQFSILAEGDRPTDTTRSSD